MEFGLFTVFDNYEKELNRSHEQFLNEVLDQSVLADELGFDSVWYAEHHFSEYGVLTSPEMLLSVVAERTKNIRLGVSVVILPFKNPIDVAEDYALLDILSNGRLNLGLGSGYLPHEFAGFNLDPTDKAFRFNDSLAVIEKAWTGETFSHDGDYFEFKDTQLIMTPKQEEVPIWIGALSDRGSKFVGKMGYNIMGVPYVASSSIDELKGIIDGYKEAYKESGKDVNKVSIPMALHTYVAETREEAERVAKEHVNLYLDTRQYGRSAKFEDLREREQLLIGTADEVIEKLKKYQAIGCNHIMMLKNFGGMPSEKVQNSMRLIAEEVMPAFQKS